VITFVIATAGRATLERAIASLPAQDDPTWRAIRAGDGLRRPGCTNEGVADPAPMTCALDVRSGSKRLAPGHARIEAGGQAGTIRQYV
jgi:hypothetical protein